MILKDLEGKRVGMCVSGGLDSKTVTKLFKEKGIDVLCFSADLAQPDEKDINDIIKKMDPCGAETFIIDVKADMADACFEVIKSGAMYDGGYWNTTGIARVVTVRGLVRAMQEKGCDVLAHGATGRGNDQMRFERYTKVLAPEMDVYAPWRDPELLETFPGRTEMADYLAQFDIPAVIGMKKKYSTDANLAGLSHEAEDLEELTTPCTIVEASMGVWPQDAPDAIEEITIRYEAGKAVEINGKAVTPFEAMTLANEIGGRNGIWMKNALENRIIGTKSRGVYEAPGMEVLYRGLEQVYQATLNRQACALMKDMGTVISDAIYDGKYFDPACQAARAAVNVLASKASATVKLGLYKGNVYFHSLEDCPASIYNEEDSSMEASDGLNPFSSQGYADIIGVEAVALATAGQIDDRI